MVIGRMPWGLIVAVVYTVRESSKRLILVRPARRGERTEFNEHNGMSVNDHVSHGSRRRSWTDDEIDRIADADTEFPAVSDDDLARASAVCASGRVKVPISIRIDETALEAVRAEGPRYQTRINDLVVAYAQGTLCALDAEIVDAFRSDGGDWTARINEVLREHLRARISHGDTEAQRGQVVAKRFVS